ncbi:MAG: glycoside hydrolase family 3 N-terminal domain-containing protein [Pseudomonadota bacterium]
MNLRKQVSQRFIFGFHGSEINSELKDFFTNYPPAGIILFEINNNYESPKQVSELITSIKKITNDEKLIVCIDQEGGIVNHLPKPFTQFPSMKILGKIAEKTNKPELCFEFGELLAKELITTGFNTPLVPVVDIRTNSANDYIGQRSLSESPELVAILSNEIIKGITSINSACCLKHYPGHGDTTDDSHYILPVIKITRDLLNKRELIPYRENFKIDIPMVMAAHLLFPEIDPDFPCSLSEIFLKDILRNELGFNNIIVSDDLNMSAMSENFSLEELIKKGQNLLDIFLFGKNLTKQANAFEILFKENENKNKHNEAYSRVQIFKEKYCQSTKYGIKDFKEASCNSRKFCAQIDKLKESYKLKD